jgi:hypothetical protein
MAQKKHRPTLLPLSSDEWSLLDELFQGVEAGQIREIDHLLSDRYLIQNQVAPLGQTLGSPA